MRPISRRSWFSFSVLHLDEWWFVNGRTLIDAYIPFLGSNSTMYSIWSHNGEPVAWHFLAALQFAFGFVALRFLVDRLIFRVSFMLHIVFLMISVEHFTEVSTYLYSNLSVCWIWYVSGSSYRNLVVCSTLCSLHFSDLAS